MFRDQVNEQMAALTADAMRAAECGRWDQVRCCYDERATLLEFADPSPGQRARIERMDEDVQIRAQIAQRTVAQLLDEVGGARRLTASRAARTVPSCGAGASVDRRA